MHCWGFPPLQISSLGADFPSLQQTRYLHVQGVRGTEGGRSNPAPCGAIPPPCCRPIAQGSHWLMGQTLELAGGFRGTLLRSLGQREGCTQRLQMHQIPAPTCFTTQLKVGFLSCCSGGEELPALPICTMLPPSAWLPSTADTSAPISSRLSPACSSCLGPFPRANEHRARGRQLGSTCPPGSRWLPEGSPISGCSHAEGTCEVLGGPQSPFLPWLGSLKRQM